MTSDQLNVLNLISAALRLEAWLSGNVGETKDWPARINVDNGPKADALCRLLNEFSRACCDVRDNQKAARTLLCGADMKKQEMRN